MLMRWNLARSSNIVGTCICIEEAPVTKLLATPVFLLPPYVYDGLPDNVVLWLVLKSKKKTPSDFCDQSFDIENNNLSIKYQNIQYNNFFMNELFVILK